MSRNWHGSVYAFFRVRAGYYCKPMLIIQIEKIKRQPDGLQIPCHFKQITHP